MVAESGVWCKILGSNSDVVRFDVARSVCSIERHTECVQAGKMQRMTTFDVATLSDSHLTNT